VLRSADKKKVLRGISFLIDGDGRKVAVQIDLKEHGSLWKDFYDSLIMGERADERRESWSDVKKRLPSARQRRARR
jgi:hypothetical protein